MVDPRATVRSIDVGELGPLRIWLDGTEQSVRGGRSTAVLALLMVRGRQGASMDYLVEHAWPDRPPTARRSLANVVRRWREQLGSDAIITDGSSYRIGDHVRSHRQLLLDAAERIASAGCSDTEAVELAVTVADIWRGEPWSGFDELSPLIGDRMMLRDARLRLLEAATVAARTTGKTDAALRYLAQLVDERPHHERWWLELAALVGTTGDRVTALRMLQTARSSLDQVGLLPSAELIGLEHELLGATSERAATAATPRDQRGKPTLRVAEDLPFVGRADELAKLVTSGSPRAALAFVEGAAGSGKSRLIVEAARQCVGHTALSGRCEEAARSMLGPLQQILEEYVGACAAAEVSVDIRGFEGVLGEYLPELVLDVAPARSAAEEQERLVHACVSVLLRAADRQPLLLLVDDVQWAPPAALEVITTLADRADPTRLAILVTCRLDRSSREVERRITAMFAGPSRSHSSLGPLSADDLQAIVTSTDATLDVDELLQQSGGNPFFVSELVRAGLGSIEGDTVLRLVRARVDVVHPRAADYLTAAALVGLEFDPRLVGEVAAVDAATSNEIVDVLVRNQLLLLDDNIGGRCSFAHGLVAEAMVSAADPTERRRLHLALADAEQAVGSPARVWVEHLLEAGPLVEASTLVTVAVKAARQLISQSTPEVAVALLERVLEYRLGPQDQVRTMTILGRALLASDRPGEDAVLLRASDIAIENELDAELAEVALAHAGGGAWVSRNREQSVRLLNLALDRCPSDRADLRIRLEAGLSAFAIFSGSLDERSQAAEHAVAIARESGDSRMLGDALNAAIVAVSCPGNIAKTKVFEDEMLRLETAGLAFSEMRNRPAISTFWIGDGDRFRADVAQRRSDVATTHRQRKTLHTLEIVVAVLDGDTAVARALLADQILDSDVEKGNYAWNTVAVDWIDGNVGAALPVVRSTYEEFQGPPLRYTLLWMAAEAGEDDLTSELRDAVNPRRIARLPELFLGGFGLASLAMTAAALDDGELAEMVTPELARLSGQMIGVPWSSFPSADFFLAVNATVLGDAAAAQEHAGRARAVHSRMRAPVFDDLLGRYVSGLSPTQP